MSDPSLSLLGPQVWLDGHHVANIVAPEGTTPHANFVEALDVGASADALREELAAEHEKEMEEADDEAQRDREERDAALDERDDARAALRDLEDAVCAFLGDLAAGSSGTADLVHEHFADEYDFLIAAFAEGEKE